MNPLDRISSVALDLTEAARVDIAAWGDHPTFRVRGKNFVFADAEGTSMSVKLSIDEATSIVATEDWTEPTSHGLGRHGWITVTLPDHDTDERWDDVEEWIVTSYTLVAPKALARQVMDEVTAATED